MGEVYQTQNVMRSAWCVKAFFTHYASRTTYGLIIITLLIAAALRLWQVGTLPPGLHYDEAADTFSLQVNGGDPYAVVRQFREAGGPEALLPGLKAQGLVLDDPECLFVQSTDKNAPEGWTIWDVEPTGKRKTAFEALPGDEVPEPPCGELGMAVDFAGFFMVHRDFPDRILYVNLGQDGTMFDLGSLTLRK